MTERPGRASGGGRQRTLCMLVHAHYPLGEPRVQREARAAVADGWDVEVVCLRGPDEPARDVVDGVRVRRLPLSHARGIGLGRMVFEYVGFMLMAAGVLSFRRRVPDVVQVHTPPDFLAFAALPLRLRGASVIVDIHDLSTHMWEVRFEPGLKRRAMVGALRLVERLACRLGDAVVTVHEPYRGELVSDGVPADKIEIVMNSPDDAVIAGARNGGPNGDRPSNGFTVAYHGTITPWYGVDLVIEAFARVRDRVPEARAVILGEGDALEPARRIASDLGVDDGIEFSGRYLPIVDALRGVASADCGVVPNRPTTLNRFALSSKLFEYVALGVPAVVARLETLAAHFSEDEVTFFEPGDPESLAAALEWVARNPADAREKAARALERAELYSWQINRSRYLDVLNGVAGVPACAE